MTKDAFVNRLATLFSERGAAQYGGEAVSQLEHALQAAYLAQQQQATAEEIVAALLHDVGHLLHNLGENCVQDGLDDQHEELAIRFLRKYLPQSITETIRLHVVAKRYLCTVDSQYQQTLSAASIQSLRLQGGLMSEREIQDFENHPHFQAALALRHRDDAAKVPGLHTPKFDDFRPLIEDCVHESA